MTSNEQQPAATTRPENRASQWTLGDRLVVEAVLLLLSWGVVALVFALVGWFRWWAVVPVALILFAVARRALPKATGRLDRWWVIAIAISAAIAAVNFVHPGEHLLTGRDGGTYLTTAAWLANEGTLLVDARVEPFAPYDELQFHVPGFYDRVGGREELEPQFMHMFPAMMATLIGAAGVLAGLAVNPIAGFVLLLALFSLTRRFARPWAALLGMSMVGSSLVFLFYARTPFAEVLMAMFALAGLGLLGLAEERRDLRLGLISGVLLGAATLARLDGIVLLLPVTAYLLIRGGRDDLVTPVLRRARYGMYLTALSGLAESLYVSPAYILERSRNVVPVLASVLVLLVVYDLSAERFGRVRS